MQRWAYIQIVRLGWDKQTYKDLHELTSHPKVVAIGEIGLDYYRDRAPKEIQKQVFLEQLDLAAERNLPVVLHNRQASGDMLDILTTWQVQLINSGSECSRSTRCHAFIFCRHGYSPASIVVGVLHRYHGTRDIPQCA